MLPGCIAVIAQINLRGIAFQQPRLLIRQRRAQRGHHPPDTELGQAHHVHVTLYQNHPVQIPLLPKQVGGKNALPLIEYRGIRGIQVLGFPLAQNPPSKGQHIAILIDNWKNRPVAEHIKSPPWLGRRILCCRNSFADYRQPRQLQLLQTESLFLQMLRQRIPALGRRSQAELPDHTVAESPLPQVCQRSSPGRAEEGFMEEPGRLPVGIQQPFPLAPPPFVVLVLDHPGQGHVRPLRQLLHRFRKSQMLHIHQEGKDIPACLASEAVIQLRLPVHGEGGGLFPVKGTQAPVFPSVFLQRYISADDLHKIAPASQLIQPPCGISGRHPSHLLLLPVSNIILFGRQKSCLLHKPQKSAILPGRVKRGEFETFLTINKTKGWKNT